MSITADLPDLNVWPPTLGWRARIPLADGRCSTVAQFRDGLQQQLVRL